MIIAELIAIYPAIKLHVDIMNITIFQKTYSFKWFFNLLWIKKSYEWNMKKVFNMRKSIVKIVGNISDER